MIAKYTMQQGEGITIVLPRLLPGLNGKDGLIRKSKFIGSNKSMKEAIMWEVRHHNGFVGKVSVPCTAVWTRYQKGASMDWDNHAASFKYFMDAIVKCGIIPDDNTKIIKQVTLGQHPVKTKGEERMEVTFYPINNEKSVEDTVVFL